MLRCMVSYHYDLVNSTRLKVFIYYLPSTDELVNASFAVAVTTGEHLSWFSEN